LAEQNPGKLLLTVGYCPTEFTGAGGIVEVDPHSGSFTVLGTFQWSSDVIGCPALEDPIVTFDDSQQQLYLFFLDDMVVTILNLPEAQVVSNFEPSDMTFTGYENMAYSDQDNVLVGVSGTVTEDGFCSNGCYQYGTLTLDGSYSAQQNIPFRAVMDDSHIYDSQNNIYWAQFSYDLRTNPCAVNDSDLCMVALDATTGALISANYTDFTVYKYGPTQPDGTILTWMEGYDNLCNHPYNDFLFATVNFKTFTSQPIACISTNVTVQMDEWISSFSLDGTLFATGSGDQETGEGQLLVFNTANGKTVLNTDLSGLKTIFKEADGLFFVWSVDFV